MKYLFVIFSLCIFMSSLASAQADTSLPSKKTYEALIWGGLSIPYLPKEYHENWKTGYNVGGGIGYSLDPGSVGYGSIFATIDYGRTNFDQQKFTDSLKKFYPSDTAIGGPVKMVNVMVNLKGAFSQTKKSVAPYFLIGIGFMYYNVSEITILPHNSLTISGINKGAISWSFGIGVEAPVSEAARVFVQAKSLLGVSDPTRQYFPISAGLLYTL